MPLPSRVRAVMVASPMASALMVTEPSALVVTDATAGSLDDHATLLLVALAGKIV